MSFRKRVVILLLVVLVTGALDALLAPLVVAHGVRWWIWWVARQQGLSVEIEQIDAPFLRAVTVRNLSVAHRKGAPREISLRAQEIVLDLNLRGWIFQQRSSLLASVRFAHVNGRIRVPEKAEASVLDWRQWAHLLPDEFQFNDVNLDVTTATTSVRLREISLTASAVESGRFSAGHIFVNSPLLRQTFADLRGATSWESDRLTIGGIPLSRGLDLEELTFDFSRLTKRRLGIDLQLDTYGGTLRASLQAKAGEKFSLDLAGSAANVSLAQLSGAMGFLEPITGTVRASKFTFRGNPGQFLDATASIWMEARDFAWRARQADTVMLGATYYDRRLVVDQLYVRQRENALTINGELRWPKNLRGWAQLPFRGQVNATIPDLNSFAQLFGATTGDFSGALTAEGEFDLVDQDASGRLSCHGQQVKFRGVGLDSLGASFRVRGREATVEKFEARHAEDFLRAEGTFELTAGHRFAGRLTGAISDLSAYAPLLPSAWRTGKIGGGATFDWRGDGTTAAHSGTVQFFGHGLQLPVTPLRMPLDVTLEGSYSPGSVFFRNFKLASNRFSLGGFLTLGSDFVELQDFDLELDGAKRISGTLFLPVRFEQWRVSHNWLPALDEKQKFDVDLALDHLDLAALGVALGEGSFGRGVLTGKLAAFGPLPALQLTTDWRLENFGSASPPNEMVFHGYLNENRLEAEASAQFAASAPVKIKASLPLRLEKKALLADKVFDSAKAFSLTLDCPGLFLESLPNEWRRGEWRGLVSGNVAWSGMIAAPTIEGDTSILDVSFQPSPPWPAVSALDMHLRFSNTEAVIDSLACKVDAVPLSLRGRLTTSLHTFGLTLVPESGASAIEFVGELPEGPNVSSLRVIGGTREPGTRLDAAFVRGTFAPMSLSLTMTFSREGTAPEQATYFFPSDNREANSLLLRVAPPEGARDFNLEAAKFPPEEASDK